MKKFAVIIGLIISISVLVFCEQAPYISFDMSEGLVFTDNAGSMTSYNIIADIGYIVTDKNKGMYMVMYELSYQGPGLRPLNSEGLSERNQDHYFLVKYMKKLSPKLSLKVKANYLMEYYRLSKAEAWGEGLYDFTRTGAGVNLGYNLSSKFNLVTDLNYYIIEYPNFTDLLTEYMTNQEITDVKVNNNITKLTLGLSPKTKAKFTYGIQLSYQMKDFPDQRVVGKNGKYLDEHQEDTGLGLDINMLYQMEENIILGTELSYYRYKSNQNLQDTDQGLPYFVEDFFSYSTIDINPVLRWTLNPKHRLLFSLSYITKDFDSRQIRQEDGSYKDEVMKNRYILFSTFWNISVNDALKIQPVYFFKTSSSNYKYESYANLNYNLHYLGVNFLFEY